MRILVLAPCKKNCNEIAVYSKQLVESLKQLLNNKSIECIDEIRIVTDKYLKTKTGEYTIIKNNLSTYIRAADYINQQYDVCILHHHTDIFGGDNGNYILALASQLSIPLFTIFHAVESNPSEEEKVVFKTLAGNSEKVLAFSYLVIEFLEHYYKLNRDNIVKTEHAIPEFKKITKEKLCTVLGLSATKTVVLSAGEMKGAYGYNSVINALPSLITHDPDIVYVIIDTGEETDENKDYKKGLQRIAHQRGVLDHVLIKSKSAVKEEIESLLQACDVFVSAHINDKELDNIILAKAVSCGAAVLSTSTWFAKAVLEDQKGIFCSFNTYNELVNNLLNLIQNRGERQKFQENASLYGEQDRWSVVAKRFVDRTQLCQMLKTKRVVRESVIKPDLIPDFNFSHLLRLTDATGVLKQTKYGVLDFNCGYSLKDNAIALHTYTYAYNHTKDQRWLAGINTCLAFITHMYDDKEGWSDQMAYNRQRSNMSSEISVSRTIWALGHLYATSCCNGIKDYVYNLINILLKFQFKDIKAKAYAILGICKVLECDRTNSDLLGLLECWAKEVYQSYPSDKYSAWQWHESKIRSEMALVPLALSFSSDILKNKAYLSASKRAMRFLQKNVFTESVYFPNAIGITEVDAHAEGNVILNANEAYLMTCAYASFYRITREPKYLKTINATHNWYLGDNTISKPLYDIFNGGCYAYINGRSVSPEQTTESTCAYWLSQFALLETYFVEISENI